MGRCIAFYIVRNDVAHNEEKPLCFTWEFQDDEKVMDAQIKKKGFNPDSGDLYESTLWCSR